MDIKQSHICSLGGNNIVHPKHTRGNAGSFAMYDNRHNHGLLGCAISWADKGKRKTITSCYEDNNLLCGGNHVAYSRDDGFTHLYRWNT